MATKKTATKKATPKKTATKKASAAKAEVFRSDYKPGARVKVTRRNGDVVVGRVVEVFSKATGAFIKVNYGTKQMPLVGDFRPRMVKGY